MPGHGAIGLFDLDSARLHLQAAEPAARRPAWRRACQRRRQDRPAGQFRQRASRCIGSADAAPRSKGGRSTARRCSGRRTSASIPPPKARPSCELRFPRPDRPVHVPAVRQPAAATVHCCRPRWTERLEPSAVAIHVPPRLSGCAAAPATASITGEATPAEHLAVEGDSPLPGRRAHRHASRRQASGSPTECSAWAARRLHRPAGRRSA